jgi:hypothetical protein
MNLARLPKEPKLDPGVAMVLAEIWRARTTVQTAQKL